MSEVSYFFNAVLTDGIYDRAYDAADHAAYFANLLTNGVFYYNSNALRVISSSGMNVSVNAGKANINGYFYENTSSMNLAIGVASGTLNRIDRVVLQLSLIDRIMRVIVKAGTAAATPIAPALERTNDVYELSLAQVYVGRGIASITQANITDERLNNSVCGIVTGLIDQIDMQSLFDQQNSQFQLWFSDLQNELDSNQAANLQNQINQLEATIGYSGVTTGTTPNYEMVLNNFTLVDGTQVRAKIHATTSSQDTSLNINGLGAKRIVDSFGDSVQNLNAGAWLVVIYNGTDFQAVGLSSQFVVYS